jgi:predicted PurR-regulated permease PerM
MLMLFLCLAQIGPFPVLIPAIVWLFWAGETVSGSLLLVWSIVIGPLDNILRPVLIKKGADLPLVLIFAGVIGGLLSFGLLGLFVGPVVLAVSFRLLQEWVREADTMESSGGPVPSTEQAVAARGAGEAASPADRGPAPPPSS